MIENATPRFRCLNCNHTWRARSLSPKCPQCSSCKSRSVERVSDALTSLGKEDASAPPAIPKKEDADKVLARLVRDLKGLIYHLRGVEVMDDDYFYDTILSFCPFCGSGNEDGMHFSEKSGRLICRSCGATV